MVKVPYSHRSSTGRLLGPSILKMRPRTIYSSRLKWCTHLLLGCHSFSSHEARGIQACHLLLHNLHFNPSTITYIYLSCNNPFAFRKAKIVYYFVTSECSRIKIFKEDNKLNINLLISHALLITSTEIFRYLDPG